MMISQNAMERRADRRRGAELRSRHTEFGIAALGTLCTHPYIRVNATPVAVCRSRLLAGHRKWGPVRWQFQAIDTGEAGRTRRAFAAFLRKSCTADSDCDGAEIVFGELVTNVILHAAGPIDITVESEPTGAVTLEVRDRGPGFLVPSACPSATQLGGRGLYIVSRLCATMRVQQQDGVNIVSVLLPVTAKVPSGALAEGSAP